VPADIVSTEWEQVKAKGAELGLRLDAWQADIGRVALSMRADGTYACSIGGVVLSIPRQVGKTFIVAFIVFCLCLIYPNTTVLWTAHRLRTADETFGKLKSFAARRKIKPYVLKVTIGNGDEEIEFKNGSRILIGARERGFGRGFDKVDIEVFDEAQILTSAALDDMVPAANAAANALLFFMGTPPKPTDPGEEFERRRSEALAGDGETAYIEISADKGADVHDRAQWAKANPSYPKRTSAASMLRMLKQLGPASFYREAYGIWDEQKTSRPVDLEQWNALAIPASAAPKTGNRAFGIKFAPDGSRYGVAVGLAGDYGVHVEAMPPVPMSHGTTVLADWVAEQWQRASVIVIDGKAGATDFVNLLRARRVPQRRILVLNVDQAVAAHTMVLRNITEGTITHLAQPGLDAAVENAGRRKIGNLGGWGWVSTKEEIDVTPLDAVTLAAYGAVTTRKNTGSGRNERSRTSTSRRGSVQ
jgi:hypothetical protein